MDRIDSYIHEAFAKFQDVPEIRAQKEEMADHLRDRIRDAIAGGKSEKEAFDSVTRTVGESMPDLEQTLAEFLRKEFRNGEKPKPKTKEIYINFYRYHRAMMLLFAQILFTLLVLMMCEFILHRIDINPTLVEQWIRDIHGLIFWFNFVIGIHVVYSIAAYMWNPCRVKRVSVSLLRLLGKFVLGAIVVFIATLIFFATIVASLYFDYMLRILLSFLIFYAVFFVIFSLLGWFWQSRYVFAPDRSQDTLLAKCGLMFTTVFLVVLTMCMLIGMGRHLHYITMERQFGGSFGLAKRIQDLTESENNLRSQLQDTQNRLDAAVGDHKKLPRSGYLKSITDDSPHPMNVNARLHAMPANRQIPELRLKNGQAACIWDENDERIWMPPGIRQDYQIEDTRRPTFSFSVPTTPSSSMDISMFMSPSAEMGIIEVAETRKPRLHELSLDSDFPATDLAEQIICARNFPFEEYKLGMIQAVALLAANADATFPVRIGVGNLDSKNAKLLLTLEYDERLEQEHIPSGSTLFLGFLATHEYREYKFDMRVKENGPHEIRLQLRNESGQVIAETKVTVDYEEYEASMSSPAEQLPTETTLDLRDVLRTISTSTEYSNYLTERGSFIIPFDLPDTPGKIQPFATNFPGIFDCPEELAKSFREKTYDRESALAEILRDKKILDDFEVNVFEFTKFYLEKAVNSPEKLTDAELEITKRVTNHTVKEIETNLPNVKSE